MSEIEKKRPGPAKSYTDEEAAEVMRLLSKMSVRAVAAKTGMSKSTVHRISLRA